MTKEKQIEELTKVIDESPWRIEQDFEGCHINSSEIAEYLYSVGCHKQSEGSGNFIKNYNSIIEAERQTNISNGTICDVLKGRRKTAGGYI